MLRQYKILPQPFFCATHEPLCPSRGCKEAKSIPVGLLTCVSSNSLSAFSRLPSMTDFRQRQAVSTLTAPAARGLAPHYLVQPGTRHALYPATGTLIELPSYYNPKPIKMQQENSRLNKRNRSGIMVSLSWETGVNPVRGRRRDVETLSRYHEAPIHLVISCAHQ